MATIDLGLPDIVDLYQCKVCKTIFPDGAQMSHHQGGEACPGCLNVTDIGDVVAQVFRSEY